MKTIKEIELRIEKLRSRLSNATKLTFCEITNISDNIALLEWILSK